MLCSSRGPKLCILCRIDEGRDEKAFSKRPAERQKTKTNDHGTSSMKIPTKQFWRRTAYQGVNECIEGVVFMIKRMFYIFLSRSTPSIAGISAV